MAAEMASTYYCRDCSHEAHVPGRCHGYACICRTHTDLPQTDDGAGPNPPPVEADPQPPSAPSSLSFPWLDRSAIDPEEATHCLQVINGDTDTERHAFAMGAIGVLIATCLRFPGVESDRMLAKTLRTLRDRVPWGDAEDHR